MRPALIAAVLAAATPASASVTITAELSRDRISIDEQAALSVTVAGDQASLPEPELPPMNDFSVYESGRSQNIGIVNGQVSASVTYTYALQPRAAGRLRVPPIRAPGAAQPTPPLELEVLKAGAAPPEATPLAETATPQARRSRRPDVFLEASLDKTHAYVNEQVTLTVRFYSAAVMIGNINYAPPALTGFFVEELPPVRNGQTMIGGRPYRYSEIKTALFPIHAGKLTIGPASVNCAVAMAGGPTPDIFERLFSMTQPRELAVHSEPLALRADPLPPGAPDDFSGVIGRLSAEAALDRSKLRAGEAAALSLSVAGTGNIKSIPEPKKPEIPALRFFATESANSTDKTGDRVGGKKTFRTVIVPRASGDIRIPPFTFSYFDPVKKAYLRASTAALGLHAQPAAPGQAAVSGPSAGPTAGLGLIQDDVRYLKIQSDAMPLSSALGAFAALGPWHAAPLLALAFAALVAWRRRRIALDPRGARFRAALANAQKRLADAAALPAEQAVQSAALADEALAVFVADKLNVPAAGLTLKSALAGLQSLRRPPSDAALARLSAAWQEADLRRFAPGAAGEAAAFVSEVSAAIKMLEQEISL